MKDRLRSAGLECFDKNGYYRTGVRDVAAKAGCTLPTLYYYYGNKENLFRRLVYDGYAELTERIADQIPDGLSLRDSIYFTIMQKIMLDGDDRLVFRLAAKTISGLEGPDDVRADLAAYETKRLAGESLLTREPGGAFARLVARVTAEMQRSALLDNKIPSAAEIGEELDLLMSLQG